jgi:Bacterial Ig-like domain (group 3)/FG-GAP-like repeat
VISKLSRLISDIFSTRLIILTVLLFAIVASAQRRSSASDSDSSASGNSLTLTDPIFLAPVLYPIDGYGGAEIAIGDVNKDGVADVVAVPPSASNVSVLLGTGSGELNPRVTFPSGGYGPFALALGDANGDTKLDIVVANRCGSYMNCDNSLINVLLGTGDGNFVLGGTYLAPSRYLPWIALGDFNGDHKLDLVKGCGDGCVAIALGNGDGSFQTEIEYPASGYGPDSAAISDVNNDGKLDVVVGCSGGCVAILLGNGDGTLQPPITYFGGGSGWNRVAIADLNADHKPDVVVSSFCDDGMNCTNLSPGVLTVFLGIGDGTFQSGTDYNSGGAWTRTVAISDANRDGVPDLLVANNCGSGCTPYNNYGSVGVLLGIGDGSFQPAITYSTGIDTNYSLAVADFNRDGRPDLAVTENSAVSLMINNVGPHDPTTTSLLSSPNPSTFGQNVTLAATVNSPAGTPSGVVTFFDGTSELATVPLEGGAASYTLYYLTLGSHTITAKFEGSLKFSVSGARTNQTVNVTSTTTTVSSWQNPCGPNQLFTIAVSVSAGTMIPPTGTLTLKENGAPLATLPMKYGGATYRTKMPNGLHVINAVYSGDANDLPSHSTGFKQYIGWFPVASVNTLTSSLSHSLPGQSVTFTAIVRALDPAYSKIPDGGLVTFRTWSTLLGTAKLAGEKAVLTIPFSAAGSRTVSASYAGNAIFKSSTGTVVQVVDKFPTTTARWSSANPAKFGQPITLTARVSSTGLSAPTGTVIFVDGSTRIGSVSLSNGLARITRSTLPIGEHPIKAVYLGDKLHGRSTSSILNQIVD